MLVVAELDAGADVGGGMWSSRRCRARWCGSGEGNSPTRWSSGAATSSGQRGAAWSGEGGRPGGGRVGKAGGAVERANGTVASGKFLGNRVRPSRHSDPSTTEKKLVGVTACIMHMGC
jgi:hypothetical protein